MIEEIRKKMDQKEDVIYTLDETHFSNGPCLVRGALNIERLNIVIAREFPSLSGKRFLSKSMGKSYRSRVEFRVPLIMLLLPDKSLLL